MPASRWRPAVNTGKMRLYSSIRSLSFHLMTDQDQPAAKARIGASGLAFLAVTSICWGLNWPVTKQILVEWPPLSARGLTGIAGGALLALLALMRGQSLRVPRQQWPRLLLSAFLNVTIWMITMGLALLWLPASEAVVIAYTMPVWASLLAWLVLGERMSLMRLLALTMAFAGIAALMGGNGVDARQLRRGARWRLCVRARHRRRQTFSNGAAADHVLGAAD